MELLGVDVERRFLGLRAGDQLGGLLVWLSLLWCHGRHRGSRASMGEHGLGLLHGWAVDLGAHASLLNGLARCHLDLGREAAGTHGIAHGGRRARSDASVLLHLATRHARRSAWILRELSLTHLLIVSRGARGCCRRHGGGLGGRHAILLVHAGYVSLLCIVDLLVVLRVGGAGLRVALRGQDGRGLGIRVHLLLCRRGYRRVLRAGVLGAAVVLHVGSGMAVMGLLVLRVVGHVATSAPDARAPGTEVWTVSVGVDGVADEGSNGRVGRMSGWRSDWDAWDEGDWGADATFNESRNEWRSSGAWSVERGRV